MITPVSLTYSRPIRITRPRSDKSLSQTENRTGDSTDVTIISPMNRSRELYRLDLKDGDSESQFQAWAEKERLTDQHGFDISQSWRSVCAAHRIEGSLLDQPPLFWGMQRDVSKLSVHHMTLEEALVFLELIRTPDKLTRVRLRSKIDQGKLKSTLHFFSGPDSLSKRYLIYDNQSLTVKIKRSEGRIGKARYYVRQGCLEEIVGEYEGETVLLDPVWSKSGSPTLNYERVILGRQGTDLISGKDGKTGRWGVQGARSGVFNVVRLKSYYLSDHHMVTYKKTRFLNHMLHTSLIFNNRLTMPVSGNIKISRI